MSWLELTEARRELALAQDKLSNSLKKRNQFLDVCIVRAGDYIGFVSISWMQNMYLQCDLTVHTQEIHKSNRYIVNEAGSMLEVSYEQDKNESIKKMKFAPEWNFGWAKI